MDLSLPTILSLSGEISLLIAIFFAVLATTRSGGKIAESCRWLAFSFGCGGCRLFCQLAINDDNSRILFLAGGLLYLGWIFGVWLGIRPYGAKPERGNAVILLGACLLAFWVFIAVGADIPFLWSTLPQQTVGGFLFYCGGIRIWRFKQGDRDDWGLSALTMVLWLQALSTLTYPFTRMTGYAPYGFNLLALLTPAMGMGLLVTALIEERREARKAVAARTLAEEEVVRLAYHDPLTKLPNRLLIQDRFRQAIAYAERESCKLALLSLDLDKFKTINESLGHGLGDELICEVALRLISCVRDTDTVGRQGGDEFLVVLSAIKDVDVIAPVLMKIIERLREPCHIGGYDLHTSVSVGIALFPDDGPDFDILLKKADTALSRAKDAGGNVYQFFDEQMNVDAIERLDLSNGIRRALDQKEFILHYQPQIDILTGRVIGAEALIRWQHPEIGMIPPGRFIPIAEEGLLIVPIGEWVLGEACRQAVAWRKAGLPELVVAVNVSAGQFKRGNVEETVIKVLKETGHNPACLELELTESVLLQDVDIVMATVKRLKTLGVKLSIDDFGTGYSSLSYLKRLDVDKLKIDQSFVRDMAVDPANLAIVHAVVQMAHSLNLKTIAEGVEDIGAANQLRNLGCDEVQGFYFSRPLIESDFARFLAQHS